MNPSLAPRSATSWLAGGGDAGTRIRDFDWSGTHLGPLADWPQCLCTALDMVLHSPLPMVILWGREGIMLYNDGYAAIAASRHPQLLGMPVLLGWPEVADFNRHVLEVCLGNGTLSFRDEPLMLCRGGALEQVWVNLDYSPIHDESGAAAGVLAIVVETTQRVLADQAVRNLTQELAHEGQRLRQLFQQAPGFRALLLGPDHVFEVVNSSYHDLMGQRAMIGKPVREVLRDFEGQGYFELLDEVYRSGKPFKGERVGFHLPVADGRRRTEFMNLVLQPFVDRHGEVQGVFVDGYDVTDSVQTEQALRDSEARQAALVMLGDRLRDLSDVSRIILASSEILGRTLKVMRAGYLRLDDTEQAPTRLGEWLAEGVPPSPAIRHYIPHSRHLDAVKEGRIVMIDDVSTDERTRESADLWHSLGVAALLYVPVIVHGSVVSILRVHNATTRAWTQEEGEFVRDVGDRTFAALERTRAEAELKRLNENLEQKVAARTNELRTAEEQLRQSQKMEAIGQLTGGIAHDFNNILQGIIGGLEAMRRRLNAGRKDGVDQFMDAVLNSAHRAAGLTHRLLAFSRRQSLDVKPVDVNALVTSMSELIARSLNEDDRLELDLNDDLWCAETDANQLESALLNLAINARDAMNAGGTLTIRSENAHLDADFTGRFDWLRPGDYVRLQITDTGTGMTAEVLHRAFDPFFTTKPIGAGTGLGLSMIYGFARQSRGYVSIDSEVGRGTSVNLYLPRSTAPASTLTVDVPAPATQIGEGATVLIVEDDAAVRLVVRECLRELGYHTLEATDGLKAVETLSTQHIDLLVTDVGLPGMNGRQVAEVARHTRPSLSVLFMTGYAENAVLRSGFLDEGMAMITKPFSNDAFIAKVRETTHPHTRAS